MKVSRWLTGVALALGLVAGGAASAADYPTPKRGEWIARDFRFATGETLPELKLAYATVGEPTGEPVVILHGTAGSAASMLTRDFAGELFGPGQPLDAAKYYVILPDAIGAGSSSKPSDGLRARFPRYNYADTVRAQHLLLAEGSGSGMSGWCWATRWAACMPGSGARPIRTTWTRSCPWPRSPPRWRAATG